MTYKEGVFMNFLFAQGQQTGTPQSNPLVTLLPLLLMIVVFYFLLILPQQRKQKQHQKLLESIKKGDRVITTSGIYGTVNNVKDRIVNLVIADGVKVDFDKGYILSKINTAADSESKEEATTNK
jgi:preprotein translocase subunit YajC